MSMKTAIQSLITRLQGMTVTSNEGTSIAPHVGVFNNQIERKRDGTGYVYATPAIFVEVLPDSGGHIGMGATAYDLTLRIHVEHEHLNTEDALDQNLLVFDLRDKVIRQLNGFQPTGCSPMCLVTEQQNHDHANTYALLIDYRTHYIEQVGSLEDTELYDDVAYTDTTILVNGEEPLEPPQVEP